MANAQAKKVTAILIIFLVLINANSLFAMTMTCVIPQDSQNNGNFTNYIKLIEPKTIISFDSSQKISRFNSPGCDKFESIYRWTDSFVIECVSNSADSIKLKIESLTLQFEKTYLKNNQKHHTLLGFCKISQR